MPKPPTQSWLRLPTRLALLLGLGAFPASGASADKPPPQPGEVSIRTQAGTIYLSENGGEFRALAVRDKEQLQRLERLLRAHRGGELRLSPTMLAGAGGSGFHWVPVDNSEPAGNANSGKRDTTVKRPAPAEMPPSEATGKASKAAPAGKG